MTAEDLQMLLIDKWGYSYDVQIRKMPNKLFFQVMWRYLEQASFPMSDVEYLDHLANMVTYLEGMGTLEQVANAIRETKEKPRLGKAVSIPIELGGRASEWLIN